MKRGSTFALDPKSAGALRRRRGQSARGRRPRAHGRWRRLACAPTATPAAIPVRLSLDAVWLPKQPADLVREATVRAGADGKGQPVPLGLLGRPMFEVVPAVLHAERGELSGYVYVDLREGADLDGYVAQARAAVDRALRLQLAAGRAHRVDRPVPDAVVGAAATAADRSARRAGDVGAALPAVPKPDRSADRPRVGSVRAGGQLLDAVSPRLQALCPSLGRACFR